MSMLDELKKFSKIVADTGDFKQIEKYKPIDSTTNPSLILKAAKEKEYEPIIKSTIEECKKLKIKDSKFISSLLDRVSVNFGIEILKIIPGRVSTEVDARLSFDTDATIKKAEEIIKIYKEKGIKKERILIKIASTWEGIMAAKFLEKKGIHCNMTLLFSLPQAVLAAEVGVTLISPFVGRILDWYTKENKLTSKNPENDPGVTSVKEIYNYYKKFDYKTEIMAASFRNIDEIIELSGCDLLTISPALLEELKEKEGKITKKLSQEDAKRSKQEKISLNEPTFRWFLNENQMATEKLSEGIRRFASDLKELELYLEKNI